jgi:Ca2+-binding RTX toxin-like protein
MSGHAIGGDDFVTAGAGVGATLLFGDAVILKDHAQGGNDTLVTTAGPGANVIMYGDGQTLADHARGGNDVLISGASNDQMWGDAAVVGPQATRGVNRFVFAPGNGHDQIMDFQPGKDHIELDGFGFGTFQVLASHFQATPNGVLISFDANDDILVRGVTGSQLHQGDFVLT